MQVLSGFTLFLVLIQKMLLMSCKHTQMNIHFQAKGKFKLKHQKNVTNFCCTVLYLFFVDGSLGKDLIYPSQLVCWVLHVYCLLVLVIVQIRVQHQHSETFPVHQFFCIIAPCSSQQKRRQNIYFCQFFIFACKLRDSIISFEKGKNPTFFECSH